MTDILDDISGLRARLTRELPSAYAAAAATAALDTLRRRVEQALSPPAPLRCHWCGKTASDPSNAYGMLVDVRVEVADGEEGYANVVRYACDEHLGDVTASLVELGFFVHAHGGVCYLEPADCPGHSDPGACPTPEPQYDDDDDDDDD